MVMGKDVPSSSMAECTMGITSWFITIRVCMVTKQRERGKAWNDKAVIFV